MYTQCTKPPSEPYTICTNCIVEATNGFAMRHSTREFVHFSCCVITRVQIVYSKENLGLHVFGVALQCNFRFKSQLQFATWLQQCQQMLCYAALNSCFCNKLRLMNHTVAIATFKQNHATSVKIAVLDCSADYSFGFSEHSVACICFAPFIPVKAGIQFISLLVIIFYCCKMICP